jgi:hypothetical protein
MVSVPIMDKPAMTSKITNRYFEILLWLPQNIPIDAANIVELNIVMRTKHSSCNASYKIHWVYPQCLSENVGNVPLFLLRNLILHFCKYKQLIEGREISVMEMRSAE